MKCDLVHNVPLQYCDDSIRNMKWVRCDQNDVCNVEGKPGYVVLSKCTLADIMEVELIQSNKCKVLLVCSFSLQHIVADIMYSVIVS
jgi:hypothetical protein